MEHHDGSLELLRWADQVASLKRSHVAAIGERTSLFLDEDLVVAKGGRYVA